VGVDDHGNIAGCEKANIENTVRNILARHCEPPIHPQVAEVEVLGKTIIMVAVKEGENKPYVVREKGPFVRAGSTDRVATRYELDRFYVQGRPKIEDTLFR
jgi:predicted HTH transcriptional regulator